MSPKVGLAVLIDGFWWKGWGHWHFPRGVGVVIGQEGFSENSFASTRSRRKDGVQLKAQRHALGTPSMTVTQSGLGLLV